MPATKTLTGPPPSRGHLDGSREAVRRVGTELDRDVCPRRRRDRVRGHLGFWVPATVPGAVMNTCAIAVRFAFAVLTALVVTMELCAADGAVKLPLVSIVPTLLFPPTVPFTDHVARDPAGRFV